MQKCTPILSIFKTQRGKYEFIYEFIIPAKLNKNSRINICQKITKNILDFYFTFCTKKYNKTISFFYQLFFKVDIYKLILTTKLNLPWLKCYAIMFT